MVSGSPAFDNKQWLRAVAVFNKLPETCKNGAKLMANRQHCQTREEHERNVLRNPGTSLKICVNKRYLDRLSCF